MNAPILTAKQIDLYASMNRHQRRAQLGSGAARQIAATPELRRLLDAKTIRRPRNATK